MSSDTQDTDNKVSTKGEWQASNKVSTRAAWKGYKRHTVTLPSGAVVEIELPDLPQMVAAGNVPNDLVDIAVKVASRGDNSITADDIRSQAPFFNILAAATVKVPEGITPDDFVGDDALPFEDKSMLVEFAVRQRDMDAEGHHLGGLQKSRDFRAFRGILSIDEVVADL